MKTARRASISPFIVMEVMRAASERAASGGHVLHLEVGQPSTPAPQPVRQAAASILESNLLGYTDALGIWPLRQAIAQHYQDAYAVQVAPDQVVISTGASGAFLLAFLAVFDAGDRVALASPGYPAYRNILSSLGVEVVNLPMTAESKFQPTIQALDAVPGELDGLIIASPSNPVGALIPEPDLRSLAAYCTRRGIRLISDEIYHGITYADPASTIAGIAPDAIVVNSFSKYFSMTGWRLGWLVVPHDLIRPIERLAQNLFISAPSISQYAALAAFESHDELQANVRRYADNLAVLLAGLPSAGIDQLVVPDGAFYLYADVSRFTSDSVAYCRQLLDETAVAITPGVDFDPERGSQYARFSFAGSTDDMRAAVERLQRFHRR